MVEDDQAFYILHIRRDDNNGGSEVLQGAGGKGVDGSSGKY